MSALRQSAGKAAYMGLEKDAVADCSESGDGM